MINQQDKELPEYMSRYMDLMQKELDGERIRRMGIENQYNESSGIPFKQEQNLVEYQLDLKEELDNIFHLLSGHVIEADIDGNEKWKEPDDDRLKIFSKYGVKQIMNIISFYINRNTLLSNYDEETINWKIKDFGLKLIDLIYNRYEAFFHYPTPEDLFESITKTLKISSLDGETIYINPNAVRKISIPKAIKVYDENGQSTLQLTNEYIVQENEVSYFTERELYYKCIAWSREELQSKFRHYPMIILAVIDSVHSSYLRALKGEERDSLRKFMHISQSNNPMQNQMIQPQKNFSVFRPSTWKNT